MGKTVHSKRAKRQRQRKRKKLKRLKIHQVDTESKDSLVKQQPLQTCVNQLPPCPVSPSRSPSLFSGSPLPVSPKSGTNLPVSPESFGSPSTPPSVNDDETACLQKYRDACRKEHEAYEVLDCSQHQISNVEMKMSTIERKYAKEYIEKVRQRERSALDMARFYEEQLIRNQVLLKNERIKSATLQHEEILKHKQKCAEIRKFWKEKIFEGGSRSGTMVRLAMTKK